MTLRSLLRMEHARQKAEWERTASMLSVIYNAHLAKGKASTPADFNPYAEEKKARVIGREEAKQLFRSMANSMKR